MVRLPGFQRKKPKTGRFLPKEKSGGKEYYVVTESDFYTNDIISMPVKITGVVTGKPKVITRLPHPVIGSGSHDHYTIFYLEGGIMVGYPGIAMIKDGETVTVYGVVREKKQIIADKIVGEDRVYELQY